MSTPLERVCGACATTGTGAHCGACGRAYELGEPGWQDAIYLGKTAPLYRRGAHDIQRVLPLLLAPFRHLDAISPVTLRFAAFIALIGIAPLVFEHVFYKPKLIHELYWSFGLYFSLVWAALFAALFARSGLRWVLAGAAYFGTMIVGLFILDIALVLNLERLRDPFLNVGALWISIPSFIVFVGFPEELCKALVLFAIWRWAKLPTLRAFVYYGILSGLGFGIAEGIHYQVGIYYTDFSKAGDVIGYFFTSLLRLTSLPLLHASWAGTAAFLLWFAARVRSARAGFIILAIGIPSLGHGLYDSLSDVAPWLSFAFAAASIALLTIYLSAATQLEALFSIHDDETVAAPANSSF